jgi:hypothetical protein
MKRLVWFALLLAACANPAPAMRRASSAPPEPTPAPLPAIAGDWVVSEGDHPKVVWTIQQDGQLITGSIKPVEESGLPIAAQPIHGQFVAYGAGWQGRMESPDGTLTVEDGLLRFCPTVGSAIGCRTGVPKGATPGPSGKPPLIHG